MEVQRRPRPVGAEAEAASGTVGKSDVDAPRVEPQINLVEHAAISGGDQLPDHAAAGRKAPIGAEEVLAPARHPATYHPASLRLARR